MTSSAFRSGDPTDCRFASTPAENRHLLHGTPGPAPDFNLGGLSDRFFERYTSFLESQGLDKAPLKQPARWHENADFAQLLGLIDGNRFYFSASLAHPSIACLLADSETTSMSSRFSLRVESYSGDEILLRIETDRPGYLSFIDNL